MPDNARPAVIDLLLEQMFANGYGSAVVNAGPNPPTRSEYYALRFADLPKIQQEMIRAACSLAETAIADPVSREAAELDVTAVALGHHGLEATFWGAIRLAAGDELFAKIRRAWMPRPIKPGRVTTTTDTSAPAHPVT